MRTSILLTMLFPFVFHPGRAIAVEHYSQASSGPNLAIIKWNVPNEAGIESFQFDKKTLERQLGRKLSRIEQIGVWIARKKIKRMSRQMDGGKSREKLIRKALVIAHKTKDRKIYILTGQKITFLAKNATQRQQGRLVNFEGNNLIVEYQNGAIDTIPLPEIMGIKKASEAGILLGIVGGLLTIFGLALSGSGTSQNRSGGCLTSLIAGSIAIVGIVVGSIMLVIGGLALVAGLAHAKRYIDLTENSDWKAEIRDVPDRELP